MPLFLSRVDAGKQLAKALRRFAKDDPVVLALPRGGVPVAFEVARELASPLDVVLVRKIGVPGHEELALGAVVDGAAPTFVLNEEVAAVFEPSETFLEEAQARQLAEIERRRKLYRGDRSPASVTDRTAIVVDDGIATGATTRAALRGVRASRPKRLVLAVPVAPRETIAALSDECDEIVCLETPPDFGAVGYYYADFGQTSDEEVVRLLEAASAPHRSGE